MLECRINFWACCYLKESSWNEFWEGQQSYGGKSEQFPIAHSEGAAVVEVAHGHSTAICRIPVLSRGARKQHGVLTLKAKKYWKKASERKVTEEFAESGICQKNGTSNGGIWDCTWEKAQQEHSMLVEAWTGNFKTFWVLCCRESKFMIHWVMTMQSLQRETSTDFQLEWDTGLFRSNRTPQQNICPQHTTEWREGSLHFLAWIHKADTIQFKTVQYHWTESASKIFYIVSYYIMPALLAMCNKLLKSCLGAEGKKIYNTVSILIKCFFFTRDFMLVF